VNTHCIVLMDRLFNSETLALLEAFLYILLYNFTVSSTEGLTATCAAVFGLS